MPEIVKINMILRKYILFNFRLKKQADMWRKLGTIFFTIEKIDITIP